MNTLERKNSTLKNVKSMTYCAILIALAILIPNIFAFARVTIGPVTATLASHVPMFISMFLGPVEAVFVGIGSVVGFGMNGVPTPVVLRASVHIVVGFVGAYMLKKDKSYLKAVIVTLPIHAILEAVIIIPVVGFTSVNWLVLGVTALHHVVDAFISAPIVRALMDAKLLNKKELV